MSIPTSAAKRHQRSNVFPGSGSSFRAAVSKSLSSFWFSVQEPQKEEGDFSAFALQSFSDL